MKTFPLSAFAIATIAAGFAPGGVHAASVFASAFVAEGNQFTGNFLGTFASSSTPGQTATGNGGSSHDLSTVGGSGLLEYDGQASATASYNALKAAASGSVTNSYYDEDYDADAGTGIPQAYFAQGSARFTQTLQYGGTATSYTSIYALRLTGSVAGSGRAAVIVQMTHALAPSQSWVFDTIGSYEVMLFSQAYIHGLSPQEFTLRINTLYSFDMDDLADGGSYSGSANFGNTLEVVGIDLRDEFGILQAPGSITSDTGEVFTIIAVPEPSGMLLVCPALALACFTRGRRKSP